MLSNLLSYSGITTKVKSMESNLISTDGYDKIANLESTSEFILFLKNMPTYADVFTTIDENMAHRGQIELLLINSLYRDFTKIYRFANIKQRKILSLTFFRYEVNMVKRCLQVVYNHDKPYDLSMYGTFFNKHSKLNLDTLVTSSSIDEFISNLKNTDYFDLFKSLQNTNRTTMFDYEMGLDIYYFKTIWKQKDYYLSKNELDVLTHKIGNEIDLMNIMWVYRSKKYYDINIGDISSYVIPINYRLTKAQLTKLIEAPTMAEFTLVLSTTYYHSQYGNLDQDSMESMYHTVLAKLFKITKLKYPSSIAPINSFLYLKEQEIDNLTTALECIRYDLEPEETLKYVLQ